MRRVVAVFSLLICLSACSSATPVAPAPTNTRLPTVTPLGTPSADEWATLMAVSAATQAFLPTAAPPKIAMPTEAQTAEPIVVDIPTPAPPAQPAVPRPPTVLPSLPTESASTLTPQTGNISAETNVWMNIGPRGGTINALAIDPTTPTILYAGTDGNGVFKSTNGGENWNAVNTGLTNADVRALAIDPKKPTTLYAGTWEGGVFKSVNGGDNWQAINTGLTSIYVNALEIDPVTPTTLYAGTLEGVFKSTNGGENWIAVNTGLTIRKVYSLAIDPMTPTTLYVGTDYTQPPPAPTAVPLSGLLLVSITFNAERSSESLI